MAEKGIKLHGRLLSRLLFCVVAAISSSETQAKGLSLALGGSQVKQETFSLFAVPGEILSLDLIDYDTSKLNIRFEGVEIKPPATGIWRFSAPLESGLYSFELEYPDGGEATTLNVFVGTVLTPQQESLEGYRIGPVPSGHSENPQLYRSPRLYVRVTREMLNIPLSDHFTLGQFLCKQESTFPKYLALSEELLVLLEGLVGAVQRAGYPIETFGIISGYRTPYYNSLIGNVAASRHVYGDALDFYVDVNKDGLMDDLDGDGDSDRKDIDMLFDIVEDYRQHAGYDGPPGGIGRYYKTSRHSGFVHVDTRGYRARW